MVALGFIIGYLGSIAFIGIGYYIGINVKIQENEDEG